MRMNELLAISGIAGLLAAAGCAARNDGPAARLDASASTKTASADAGPIENYKQQVFREATEGLRYDTGRVEIDAASARTLEGVGDPEAAQAHYEEGRFQLGNHNNFLGAIRAFSDAVIMAPDEARYYVALGQALDYKGSPEYAQAAYRTAIDLDPMLVEAHARFAANLYGMGEAEQAIDVWREVLALDPDHAEAHGMLARALYYEHEYDTAWRHLVEAERLGENMPQPLRSRLAARRSEPEG